MNPSKTPDQKREGIILTLACLAGIVFGALVSGHLVGAEAFATETTLSCASVDAPAECSPSGRFSSVSPLA